MRGSQAYVLIASGFDEESVVSCVSRLRKVGVGVALVSLSSGLVSSAHGLVVRPDMSLEQVAEFPLPKLILIAGNGAGALPLLADPRVPRLIERILSHNGFVAATTSAQAALTRLNLSVAANAVLQDEAGLDAFITRLIHVVTA